MILERQKNDKSYPNQKKIKYLIIKHQKRTKILFILLVYSGTLVNPDRRFQQEIKIFIIYIKGMQVRQESSQQQEQPTTVPDLKLTPMIAVSSLNDIYQVSVGEASYIAKVFLPTKLANFQKEKSILAQLDHPHIIKPIDFSHALVSKVASSVLNSFILFPECPKGDLLAYLSANGGLSQGVTLFFMKQIVEALSFAHERLILHPHLIPTNILIDDNRNALICGWSDSFKTQNQTLKNLLFEVGELTVCFFISRSPFCNKDYKHDTYGKFLNEKYIGKFWQEIQKRVQKFNQSFRFSEEIKELVSGLFLGKVGSFQEILDSKWFSRPIEAASIYQEIKEQENKALKTKQIRKNKMVIAQKQQKDLIKSNFTINLSRKPSRASDIFQEEYENFENDHFSIEEKAASDHSLYFQIFDQDVRLIVSHLRTRLKQAEKDEPLIDTVLILKDSQVSMTNTSSLKVNFTFGWNCEEMEEGQILPGFKHEIDLILRTEKNHLWGRLELNEALELNASYAYQLNKWIIEALQHYG